MKCISENEKQNVTVIYVDMHILLNPPSSDMMRLVVWIIETKPRFTYFLHQVNKMDIVPDFTDTSCVTYSLLHWSHIVMALNRFLDSVSAVAFSRDYLPLTGVERVPGIVFGGWILKNVKSRKVTLITFPPISWCPGLKCLSPNAINQSLSEPDEWTSEHYFFREISEREIKRKNSYLQCQSFTQVLRRKLFVRNCLFFVVIIYWYGNV